MVATRLRCACCDCHVVAVWYLCYHNMPALRSQLLAVRSQHMALRSQLLAERRPPVGGTQDTQASHRTMQTVTPALALTLTEALTLTLTLTLNLALTRT